MLNFYLDTVMIYFLIFMGTGIALRKPFIEASDKLKEALNDESKRENIVKTVIFYMGVSFIPVFRLMVLLSKLALILNTEKMIELMKEREEENNDKD